MNDLRQRAKGTSLINCFNCLLNDGCVGTKGFNGAGSCSDVENTDVCVYVREAELTGVSLRQARGGVPFGNDMAPEVQRKSI